jgi:hypothetical protein
MMDGDEQLAAIRARLNPEPPPWPDQREEVIALNEEIARLRHRLMCREFENSGLYAKLAIIPTNQEKQP